ncbi:uncharacterized protein LOC125227534 [Leguminivora glycinivorella]|uniref:uncharacterized protein LOC125227534 n=1 Tax=Leguminivora glycinivorella TaxID=1035111 RepID=UPI00200C7B1A|nr:uncharacterized protein LOC125227534 [Leguminivora glycinivorella]
MFGYSKEAVRVKVKKCEGKLQPELRKFSVDPQITSLEVLQSILVKAFDIKSDFTLSYRSADDYGQEIFLPLLSDWDLDAAFLKAHNIAQTQRSEPCVQLRVDMKPFAEASEDWEPPGMSPAPREPTPTVAPALHQPEKQEGPTGFQGLFMNQVEKTFNMVSRALNLYEDPNTPPRAPLSDSEFRTFLDTVGQITNTTKLREVIYCGGIDPSLRKVVWKHILNVYPDGMTGKERMDYIKRKANEYYTLRARWKDCIQKGIVNADLAYVTSMVRKDVLRTDRHHNFYAGSDDNQNIASLFNILTTYALQHPRVSYCQGMSDLASPLLVTMGDEAHAYICLCALMARLHCNFLLDGETMTLKFAHLTEALQVYDPDFYAYLKSQQADDLLFCYRWLLLEMKREFAFDDALRMLEVLWASLPQRLPSGELSLAEREFDATADTAEPPPLSPLVKAPRDNAYTKLCAIRRQSSSFSLAPARPRLAHHNHSLDDSAAPHDDSLRHAKEFQSLDDAALQTLKDKLDDDLDTSEDSKRSKLPDPNMTSVPETQKRVAASNGSVVNGKAHPDGKDTTLGGQIRLLRDKISVHNNKFDGPNDVDPNGRPKVKMIKNLNEFLNFATSGKPDPIKREKLQRAHSVIETTKEYPKITLNKMSMDESDLSKPSVKESLLNKINRNIYNDANDGSSPDDSQEYYPMTTSMTRELRLELEHLDRQVFGPSYVNRRSMIDSPSDSTSTEEKGGDPTERDAKNTLELHTEIGVTSKRSPMDTIKSNARSAEDIYLWENPLHARAARAASCPHTPDEHPELELDDTADIFEEGGRKSVTPIRRHRAPGPGPARRDAPPRDDSVSKSHKFFSNMSQELENAKRNCESLLTAKPANLHSVASTINNFQKKYEALKPPSQKTFAAGDGARSISGLPPPGVFGGGNPFLMFLCLTVLLQHRDYVMRNRMDYNELAMHFDKMVRKHNVNRVLNQARHMYAVYLKHQNKSDVTT